MGHLRLFLKDLIITIAVGVGFTFLICFAFVFFGPVVNDYIHRKPFNAVQWKDERFVNSRNPIKIRMVDDLLNKKKLIGMSKSEINELLGMPPKTAYFSNYDYVYWLGPERGLISIDSEWLAIKFENDKAIEAKIVTD